jgi:hypothetical protein
LLIDGWIAGALGLYYEQDENTTPIDFVSHFLNSTITNAKQLINSESDLFSVEINRMSSVGSAIARRLVRFRGSSSVGSDIARRLVRFRGSENL